MPRRIFGRLTAWQGWIFNRPNAVGEKGALKVYGTGSAPMRVMTEWRRRLRETGRFDGGKLLFFGVRSPQELPYSAQRLKNEGRLQLETH